MADPIERYVDSATGNDTTGDGLSFATAWKTIQKGTSTITSGPAILNIRGTFTDQNVTLGYTPAASTGFSILGHGDLAGGKTLWNPGAQQAINSTTLNHVTIARVRSTDFATASNRWFAVLNDFCSYIDIDLTGVSTSGQSALDADVECLFWGIRARQINPGTTNLYQLRTETNSYIVNCDTEPGNAPNSNDGYLIGTGGLMAFSRIANCRYPVVHNNDQAGAFYNTLVGGTWGARLAHRSPSATTEHNNCIGNAYNDFVGCGSGFYLHNLISGVRFNTDALENYTALTGILANTPAIGTAVVEADGFTITAAAKAAHVPTVPRGKVGIPWDN